MKPSRTLLHWNFWTTLKFVFVSRGCNVEICKFDRFGKIQNYIEY